MQLIEAEELLQREKRLGKNLKAIIYNELARLPLWVLSDLDEKGFVSIVSIFRYAGLEDIEEAKHVYQNMIATQSNEKLKLQSGLDRTYQEPRKLAARKLATNRVVTKDSTSYKLQLVKENLENALSIVQQSDPNSRSEFVTNANAFIQWLDAA
jgi:hypothetical protein